MFDYSPILVGLEIGTSKICAVVAELNSLNELTVTGIGQEPSRGVRKGELVDVPKTAEDVRKALVLAEKMANVEINAVYLAVTGGHVSSTVLRGILPIATAHRKITKQDIEDAVGLARQSNAEPGFEVIDSVRRCSPRMFTPSGPGQADWKRCANCLARCSSGWKSRFLAASPLRSRC
jgi:cell division protein FtsA